MKLISLFILFIIFLKSVESIPEICTVAQRWSINGKPFVEEFKGRILFLIFMRLDCAECETTIKKCDSFMKYEAIAEHFNNQIEIVIVAPRTELSSRVIYMKQQYTGVRIVKESAQEPLWNWMRVRHNDGLIYDRCGRLAKHLILPREGIETSQVVFDSLKSVIKGQSCGYCSYDHTSQLSNLIKPTQQLIPAMITAYVSSKSRKNQGSNQKYNNFQHSQQQQANRRKESIQTTQPSNAEEFESITVSYSRKTNNYGGKIYAQQQQPGVFNNDWVEISNNDKFGKNDNKNENNDKKKKLSITPEPLYPETYDDESNYYDYIADSTTPIPPDNVQIPKPSMPSKSWPTKAPSIDRKTSTIQTCAGYNDEICYQQFLQFDEFDIHPCCRKKVVLTDQCVPGKCSNSTQQLCCIQKFLQAKLTCCLDESQSNVNEATDKFSKCCHDHFVTENDHCCSHTYSSTQWKSVHELCLPNVEMDLSNIKVKTILQGTSVLTDFDFGQTKRWKFECKYGNHVPQYSYFKNL